MAPPRGSFGDQRVQIIQRGRGESAPPPAPAPRPSCRLSTRRPADFGTFQFLPADSFGTFQVFVKSEEPNGVLRQSAARSWPASPLAAGAARPCRRCAAQLRRVGAKCHAGKWRGQRGRAAADGLAGGREIVYWRGSAVIAAAVDSATGDRARPVELFRTGIRDRPPPNKPRPPSSP